MHVFFRHCCEQLVVKDVFLFHICLFLIFAKPEMSTIFMVNKTRYDET